MLILIPAFTAYMYTGVQPLTF